MSDYSLRWAITGVTLFCLLLLFFVVCCLVGIFVDPTLSQSTRGVVAICWGIGSVFLIMGALIVRHGNT